MWMQLKSSDRSDQRGPHRLGDAEEDHNRVGAELCGLCFRRDFAEACLRVVEAVANPDIAGRIDSDRRDRPVDRRCSPRVE